MKGIVAVTGATGHVGGNLVRALVSEGRPVRALVQPGDVLATLDGLDVERSQGDLGDPRSLADCFDGVETVYHLAGHVSLMPGQEKKLAAVNVAGVRNVVGACLDRRVRRLVHFSSIQALSPFPFERTVDETRPLTHDLAVPPYDRSKALGELEVAAGVARGLDAVVVNPTAIFGPFDFRPSTSGRLFLSLCRGRLPATLPAGFDWVDVRDVVDGAMSAERRGGTGRRYILGGSWQSMRDLSAEVERVTGVDAPRFEVPFAVARGLAPLATGCARLLGLETPLTPYALRAVRCYRRVSSARAAGELDYRPRPFSETVAAIVRWFRDAGMLPAAEVSAAAVPSRA